MAFTIGQSDDSPTLWFTRMIGTIDESALWHDNIFPKAAIVDPEITATLPPRLTAVTGFDAFCHNFEALISVNSSPHVENMAIDAIKRIAQYLPRAVAEGDDSEARANMCWADTLGGLSFAAVGAQHEIRLNRLRRYRTAYRKRMVDDVRFKDALANSSFQGILLIEGGVVKDLNQLMAELIGRDSENIKGSPASPALLNMKVLRLSY